MTKPIIINPTAIFFVFMMPPRHCVSSVRSNLNQNRSALVPVCAIFAFNAYNYICTCNYHHHQSILACADASSRGRGVKEFKGVVVQIKHGGAPSSGSQHQKRNSENVHHNTSGHLWINTWNKIRSYSLFWSSSTLSSMSFFILQTCERNGTRKQKSKIEMAASVQENKSKHTRD